MLGTLLKLADGKVDSHEVVAFHVGPSRFRRDAVRIALAMLVLLLAAMVAHAAFNLGGSRLDGLFVKWIYNIVLIGSAVSCLARAASVERERSAWLVLGVALLTWAGGNIYFTVVLFNAKQVPIPSWADAGYLSIYPGAYAALVLMLRSRVSEFRASIWLDGVIGALAVSAIGAAVLLKVVLATIGGAPVSVGIALAYPLLDLLLVAFVVAVGGLSGWKLDRTLLFVAAGFVVFGMSDGFYVYQNTIGTYHPGSIFDMGWPVAIVLLALAAWQPRARVRGIALDSWRMLMVPSAFALLALGVLVYGAAIGDVGLLAISLATASLLAVILRLTITFRENVRMLRASQREALTDALTHLGNRRRLSLDPEQRSDPQPNSPESSCCSTSTALSPTTTRSAIRPAMRCSRASAPTRDAVAAERTRLSHGRRRVLRARRLASGPPRGDDRGAGDRTERPGEGFDITALTASCRLPDDAAYPPSGAACRRPGHVRAKERARPADAAERGRARCQAPTSATPPRASHRSDVAHLAERVARPRPATGEEIELSRRRPQSCTTSASCAIPDAILNKPGALDDEEWALIRRTRSSASASSPPPRR